MIRMMKTRCTHWTRTLFQILLCLRREARLRRKSMVRPTHMTSILKTIPAETFLSRRHVVTILFKNQNFIWKTPPQFTLQTDETLSFSPAIQGTRFFIS